MTRRRFLFGLAALPLGAGVWFASRNQFVITNHSGHAIRGLTVAVSDASFRFMNIPIGESVAASFGSPSVESVFNIRGQFDDGSEFADSCGYVVWEDRGRQFRLVIEPGGVVRMDG